MKKEFFYSSNKKFTQLATKQLQEKNKTDVKCDSAPKKDIFLEFANLLTCQKFSLFLCFKLFYNFLLMALNSLDHEIPQQHLELLQQIQVNHDEAYLYISQGLSYQEHDEYNLACDMYTKGLEKINKALSIRCDLEYCIGPKWEHARTLQEKMERSAEMVRSQLRGLSKNKNVPVYTPPEPNEMPPSYDEACGHEVVTSQRRSSYPGNSFESNGSIYTNGQRRMSSEVVNLFCIPGDVQIFFVSHDGSVSAPNSPDSLNIYQFVDKENAPDIRPPAWLQIGNWTYPLIPGQSPALESGYGAFLFPNVGIGRDSAVGVILPPCVTQEQRAQFLELLNQLTALKGEKWTEPPLAAEGFKKEEGAKSTLSETISRGLVTGAEYLSAGIVKGAHISSDLIHKGATKARQKIQPEISPVTVDPRIKEGLKIAHEASGVALKATGYLVRKLGDLTLALGAHIAPHIREQGAKLLTSTFKSDPKEAQDTIDGVLTVAAGGVQGFSTIYMGLENAARILASSLSSETVNIVGHRYGDEAGQVVGNAVFAIGNLALTTHNVHSLGVKSIAKRTAKDAGKAVLKDYAEQVDLPKK
ncbi:spartin [Trichonephila inaurata madagascariensis]|uniref:Spartin n=1 Tax=Trichonephila inaurata madagascariensis TaxID=2747483 RepID=A0A8X6WSE8_9ARAC|nr:spartin [Trichonephila inaurata madagascariensis]